MSCYQYFTNLFPQTTLLLPICVATFCFQKLIALCKLDLFNVFALMEHDYLQSAQPKQDLERIKKRGV